jgi:ABC-type polysaccharide/polyol phosphate export permease
VTWPLRITLVGMVEFITSIPIILMFVFVAGATLTWGTALFPVAILLQFLLCLGFAMFEAGLALRWPDIEVFSSILTRAFFWGSPILWSQKNFPEWLVPWLYLNPFHGVLDLYRACVWPELLTSWTNYALSFGVIAMLFVLGLVMLYGRGLTIRRLV